MSARPDLHLGEAAADGARRVRVDCPDPLMAGSPEAPGLGPGSRSRPLASPGGGLLDGGRRNTGRGGTAMRSGGAPASAHLPPGTVAKTGVGDLGGSIGGAFLGKRGHCGPRGTGCGMGVIGRNASIPITGSRPRRCICRSRVELSGWWRRGFGCAARPVILAERLAMPGRRCGSCLSPRAAGGAPWCARC